MAAGRKGFAMGEKASQRIRLSTKISMLTILSSTGAILFLGIAFVTIFTLFFSQQAKEDIEYFLDNTGRQFVSKVRFIQEGAVSIRRNTTIDTFFHANHFRAKEVETQFAYCLDLRSESNLIEQAIPFATSAYLFNNKGDYVSTHYYPATIAAMERMDQAYTALQREFSGSGSQFQCRPRGDWADLCFRLYDDEMREMGVCIVVISMEALRGIFDESAKYHENAWTVMAGGDVVASGGDAGAALQGGKRSLCSVQSGGFGFTAAVAVASSNIYTALFPMLLLFILALILVLALVTALAYGVSVRSVRPLKEMAREISAFGQDDLAVRMKDFPVEEFHDISTVFNEMADRIDHLITQVYEKELVAARAQVKYLQAQINPHFQFNILAMLSLKAKLAGNEELYQSLKAFSKLIQGKIFREKEIKIPLSDEMELVNFYLLLQKGRYQDKLSYAFHYGDERVKECLIPRLLIEPLVENAVSHGLEAKSGPGRVDISAWEEGGKLYLVVEDDGIGFDAGALPRREKEGHTATGLANTRRLLQILYQQDYEMTVSGEKGRGSRVEIVLPAERRGADVEGDGGG